MAADKKIHEREPRHQPRFIRRRALAEMLGVSEPTIWRWERAGHIPAKIQLGPNVVGWDREEIEGWLAKRGIGVGGS